MRTKIVFFLLITFIVNSGFYQKHSFLQKPINIKDMGAISDGHFDNTRIIQDAINLCSDSGGGTVYFPPGKYLTGTIFLKDNVCLNLDHGSLIKGIASNNAYTTASSGKRGLVCIDNATNVRITGSGTIDGNGNHPVFEKTEDKNDLRPLLLEIVDSRDVTIKDIHLQNSAFWGLHIFNSDHVTIDDVSIYNHGNLNNDGIDIDGNNVVIANCQIDCDDDALCFKSEGDRVCENVVVTNCVLASNCNFIKFGTGSIHGFKNISVSNCVLRAASESNFRKWDSLIHGVKDPITGISGIALEIVDGGAMDQVTINNITMTGVQTPIFMRLGSRSNPTGSMKNVIISNIIATTHSLIPSCISAVKGFYIENVTIRDIRVNCMGEGTKEDLNPEVPEMEKFYPENRMFGSSLPAYGLYMRHAKNIVLENLNFSLISPDCRPALWFEDAQDIILRGLQADQPEGTQGLIIEKQSSVRKSQL